jgi:hypothetical protein
MNGASASPIVNTQRFEEIATQRRLRAEKTKDLDLSKTTLLTSSIRRHKDTQESVIAKDMVASLPERDCMTTCPLFLGLAVSGTWTVIVSPTFFGLLVFSVCG